MKHAKARGFGVALAVSFLVLAVLPSQASAFISFYNCISKPSHQWCDGRANGSYDGQNSWDYNEGWDTAGSTSVTVCQRVYKPSTGTTLSGEGCGLYGWTGHLYGDVQCVCYDAEVRQLSGSARNINGYADSAW